MTRENVHPNDDPKKAAKKTVKDSGLKKEKNQHQLPILPTYKYSKPFLHEAIILEGIPSFISYGHRANKIFPFEDIKESSRILRPPNREEYPYNPYEFADEQELEDYLRLARTQNIDSLYQKAKSIVRKYNDQDDYKLNLIAIDLLWSYFQDKFGTTHYLSIVGDNDSGKSSLGNTFEAIGYRTVNMTSPTAPNVFRTLDKIEPGQCTLVLDEADKIDESTDMMNILKAGYDYNKKVPKTNTNAWKVEWFFAYCLKLIIAERSPSRYKAKGVLDRSLSFSTLPGEAELDIKEVTAGHERDPQLDQASNELLDFRKLMLVYRLLHFEDSVVDIDIGVKRRNRELCKPYIRLFYGSAAQKEVEETFQTFLDTKNSKKAASIEAILIPVIIDLVDKEGIQVFSSEIWKFIKQEIDGEPYGSDEYHISDHILYRNTITRILEDKFGAESRHTKKGSKIIFNLERLQRIQKSYDIDIKIRTRLKGDSGDSGDGSDGSSKGARASDDAKTIQDFDDGNGKDKDILRNKGSEGYPIPHAIPQESSQPSQPSPIEMSNEEDKAAMLKEYDRLSALSRKKSKAASQVNHTSLRENFSGDRDGDGHMAKPPSGVAG
jgi:hypothetical protein